MAYDLLITGARVIDGTGTGSFTADVGVVGDRIALVGKADAGAKRVIRADGLAVAPGFIDNHTHYDGQMFWEPWLTPTSWQGFTTVVTGHCGLTLAPLRKRDHAYMAQALSRVEDIPLEILREQVDWRWESYPDYLDRIGRLPLGVNVVPQVGHSAVRRWVMGDDFERAATPEEIAQMRDTVRECLRAGAGGFTTSHGSHIDMAGRPVASRFGDHAEVLALADVLGAENAGVYQMSTETMRDGLVAEERAFLENIAQATRRPVVINAFDLSRPYCADQLAWLEAAGARGARLRANFPAIEFEVVLRLGVTNLLTQRFPLLAELGGLPRAAAVARLRDPEVRARAKQDLYDLEHDGKTNVKVSWERCWVSAPALARNAPLAGRSVPELARAAGKDTLDYLLDLSIDEDLETEFRMLRLDIVPEELLSRIARSPNTLVGISDGGAHLNSFGTSHTATSFLATWVRDHGLMRLEEAVRKLSFAPAVTYGLAGRGLIQEGYFADLVVFDPETINYGPSEVVRDLPGGRERIIRRATGIPFLIVNGEVVQEDGEPQGALPGKVLRNARAAA
jgi:N-acyl-D-aspartate/D-glutamate deacylase